MIQSRDNQIATAFTAKSPGSLRSRWSLALIGLGVWLLNGCNHAPDPSVAPTATDAPSLEESPFQGNSILADITAESKLRFQHQATNRDPFFMPLSIGSGVALLDYDDDGRLDVYLIHDAGPGSGAKNQLFHQNLQGSFDNVSKGSGLDVDGYGMGAAVGDVNNDGKVDVVVTDYARIRLFVNAGQGSQPKFIDATETSGLDNPSWATSASFFDFDRDGWLDLVVVNYVDYDPARRCTDAGGRLDFCGPRAFGPLVARLFRNLGAQGSSEAEASSNRVQFEDVTLPSGLANQLGTGLGVYCGDFNADRWPDILVANDARPNHLWINRQDGTFVDEAPQRGLAYNGMGEAESDMGIAVGDIEGDGDSDVFIAHRNFETHTLWRQEHPGVFVDCTATAGILGIGWRGTAFGTTFADLDNDGDLDLLLANGDILQTRGPIPPVSPELDKFWHPYAQRDQLLLNDGNGVFRDASYENSDFSEVAAVSRGLACGDLDNDGRLDVVVNCTGESARLFRNIARSEGNWLTVRALDPALNRDAYGAEVRVTVGSRTWLRVINPGYSFLSSNDPRAHFGLGTAPQFDSVHIIWPDGSEESFPGGETNRLLLLRRGEGTAIPGTPSSDAKES